MNRCSVHVHSMSLGNARPGYVLSHRRVVRVVSQWYMLLLSRYDSVQVEESSCDALRELGVTSTGSAELLNACMAAVS